MNKLLTSILVALVSFSVFGCGASSGQQGVVAYGEFSPPKSQDSSYGERIFRVCSVETLFGCGGSDRSIGALVGTDFVAMMSREEVTLGEGHFAERGHQEYSNENGSGDCVEIKAKETEQCGFLDGAPVGSRVDVLTKTWQPITITLMKSNLARFEVRNTVEGAVFSLESEYPLSKEGREELIDVGLSRNFAEGLR
jgi:hypothetical protein